MSQRAVDISNLHYRYGKRTALSAVSVSVPEGILFGLLGPNGGGKTTLLRILSTLLRPSEGDVRVLGTDVTRSPDETRRRIGIIFQDVALDDELTVLENLHAHAALHGLAPRQIRQRLDALLSLMDLKGRERDRVGKLSGGLKRRVDLVRGLLHAPPVLLLDEPTSGLDPAARAVFWEIIERVRHQERMTLIVATHSMDEADRCDQLAIIDEGRLMASGSPDELKAELGSETLWIESDDAHDLARAINAHFGLGARVIGARVQISDPKAHDLLSALYEVHADRIRSATVRRPTLEDVFMVHSGHALERAEEMTVEAE